MYTITLKIPEKWVHALDELVARGEFPTRSEAIRYAIRELLKRYEIFYKGENP